MDLCRYFPWCTLGKHQKHWLLFPSAELFFFTQKWEHSKHPYRLTSVVATENEFYKSFPGTSWYHL